MTPKELKIELESCIPIGTVLDNPGLGASVIRKYNDEKIAYRRGGSTMYLSYSDFCAAYNEHRGQRITTNDLKQFAPGVFDSSARPSGHSCNCTVMFMLLRDLGLAGEVEGKGVRGDPFAIEVL